MKNIAVYGGSFDPPHKGHKKLLENLLTECNAEKALIIPAASSPFKNGTVASSEDRLNMCKLEFSEDIFTVLDIEIKRGGKSYTVDTLNELKTLYPDKRIFLLMGDDMFLSLKNWYKYDEIISLCTVVACVRTNDFSYLNKMKRYAENELNLKESEYIISEQKPFPVSSTEIRNLIKSSEDCSNSLSKEVYDYIIKRRLYLNEN